LAEIKTSSIINNFEIGKEIRERPLRLKELQEKLKAALVDTEKVKN